MRKLRRYLTRPPKFPVRVIATCSAGRDILLSDHAIVRYIERVRLADIESICQEIVSPGLLKTIDILGGNINYPGPADAKKPYFIVVRNYKVITIMDYKERKRLIIQPENESEHENTMAPALADASPGSASGTKPVPTTDRRKDRKPDRTKGERGRVVERPKWLNYLLKQGTH